MNTSQLRVYKNRQHVATIPTNLLRFGTAGCPRQAIKLMQQFISGQTAATRYGNWSWEWQTLPKE